MAVSVIVYYKGGLDRRDELSETLARVRRRADALPAGRKLTVAEERIGKVEERIEEMDTGEADAAMRSKFHQDMRAMVKSCSVAISGSVTVEYREPDETTSGSLVWLFRGNTAGAGIAARIMGDAGLKETDSHIMGAIVSRHDFALNDLNAAGCNRIRLAVEKAARALREEYRGEKASDKVGGCVHADERQVSFGGTSQYGAVRAAAIAIVRVRRAGEGRRLALGRAGGLHMGSGEWLTPGAEIALWIRETTKWINREGRVARDELEAQIGARVGNEPSRDAGLFDQTARAIAGAAHGRFDGEALEPKKKEE